VTLDKVTTPHGHACIHFFIYSKLHKIQNTSAVTMLRGGNVYNNSSMRLGDDEEQRRQQQQRVAAQQRQGGARESGNLGGVAGHRHNNGSSSSSSGATSGGSGIKSLKKMLAQVLPMSSSSKKRQAAAHVVAPAQQNRGDNIHPASVANAARASSPRRLRQFLSGDAAAPASVATPSSASAATGSGPRQETVEVGENTGPADDTETILPEDNGEIEAEICVAAEAQGAFTTADGGSDHTLDNEWSKPSSQNVTNKISPDKWGILKRWDSNTVKSNSLPFYENLKCDDERERDTRHVKRVENFSDLSLKSEGKTIHKLDDGKSNNSVSHNNDSDDFSCNTATVGFQTENGLTTNCHQGIVLSSPSSFIPPLKTDCDEGDIVIDEECEEMKRQATSHLPNSRTSWPPGIGRADEVTMAGPQQVTSTVLPPDLIVEKLRPVAVDEVPASRSCSDGSGGEFVLRNSNDATELRDCPETTIRTCHDDEDSKQELRMVTRSHSRVLSREEESRQDYSAAVGCGFEKKMSFRSLSMVEPFSFSSPAASSTPQAVDVMDWLATEAPDDVLPRILSFAGSRKLVTLSRVNKKWRDIVLSESTWRTACEDTGKWKAGDPTPKSWLHLYKRSPCVPIDYSTIHSALESCKTADGNIQETCKVLLYPAIYNLRSSLYITALGHAKVSIEALDVAPRGLVVEASLPTESLTLAVAPTAVGATSSSKSRKMKTPIKKLASLSRSVFSSCQNGDATDPNARNSEPVLGAAESDAASLLGDEAVMLMEHDAAPTFHEPSRPNTADGPRRAKIVFKTRKHNLPIVHVYRGAFNMTNIDLRHDCHGTDIWNGNTAVQVQPPFNTDGTISQAVAPDIMPEALLDNLDIYSKSGRGIVSIDGGSVTVRSCHVHHCAATGVYIGGPGSQAIIEQSDVLYNGKGNIRPGRGRSHGIARGHSGIYLEQGAAQILDSNVSYNSLTGVSAISTDNAFLTVADSDLIANGSLQIEMPPDGTRSFSRSVTRNNVTRPQGVSRSRSTVLNQEALSSSRRDEPQSPASPPASDTREGLSARAEYEN
jgi:hypothetical protein